VWSESSPTTISEQVDVGRSEGSPFSRSYSPSPYKSLIETFFPLTIKPRNWPGTSRPSSSEKAPRGSHLMGKGYIDGFGPYEAYPPARQPKWTEDDLEKYFAQLPVSDELRPVGLVRPTRSSSLESEISGDESKKTTVPERNKVVLDKIRRGRDTRTTIMVKNVPNKYTQVPTTWDKRTDCSKC
jgi:hypothetical protein